MGQCPVMGCSSERAYADECSLGHQYMSCELINPKSVLSGETPEMRDVINWYFKLDDFNALLKNWIEDFKTHPTTRGFVVKSFEEFLEPPVIYIKREHAELLDNIKAKLPEHIYKDEGDKKPVILIFDALEKREEACSILSKHSIRYRTGKTLVPFRITGNIEWGVKAPVLDELDDLTVWVWPESLWAPISFTKAFLEKEDKDANLWKDWWCSDESKVYQFIGEDNVYFYGPAEMAMFKAYNGKTDADSDKLRLPELIVNNHILFLNKKASSSGEIKPPMAKELLNYYTAEQLRAHFLGLGLGLRSVSFQPKPFNPAAGGNDSDPVLKEGNLLTNVFNRAVRTAFYTAQKYFSGKIPIGDISYEVLNESRSTILEYERLMYRCEFHLVMSLMDTYIRNMNKYASANMRQAEESGDIALREQTLID
jgi:methionyl-tRNA synthetase